MRLNLFLIAAFCRLAKSLSHSEQMGWLVGAVGIEIASLHYKDLHGNDLAPSPISIVVKCCQLAFRLCIPIVLRRCSSIRCASG